MRVLTLFLIFVGQAALASDASLAVEDLKNHVDDLTLVVIGRPGFSLPKVGDRPCFTKLHSGKAAFGTQNDAWFGGAPSASDIKITRKEMLAVVQAFEEKLLQRSVRRIIALDELKRSAPGYPTHVFEGGKEGLTAGAVAVGYTAADSRIVYYLVRFDDRDEAIQMLTKLQGDVNKSESAATVIGNVIWRLKERNAEPDGAANVSQPFSSQEKTNVIGGWLPSLAFALGA